MKTAGQKTDAVVEFVDIYPSLIELCGLPPTKGLEGQSFVPLLQNPKAPWTKLAFSEYPKGGYLGTAMRTDRYRYVEWRNKKGELVATELYDHLTDPQENENIAVKPENAGLLKQLATQLAARKPGSH
jgi:arylsulfatase A-like enzyme